MIRNTESNYGSIAKALHWTTAALFLGAYATVYYRIWFTERGQDDNWVAIQLNLSFGISVAVLVILRIVWMLTNKRPRPEPGNRLAHRAAHFGHLLLYAVLILVPLTGYLGSGIGADFYFLKDLPEFQDTKLFRTVINDWMGLSFQSFEKPMDFVHKEGGAWLVWVLIAGHATAALYHHYVLKDRTLIKMTTGRG